MYGIHCTYTIIIARPSNDIELMVANITYQSVNLSWSSPTDTGGFSTVNYIITVIPLNGDNSWNITTDDGITSYIVTGLVSNKRYNFTIRANNSIGEGETSNSVSISTLEG